MREVITTMTVLEGAVIVAVRIIAMVVDHLALHMAGVQVLTMVDPAAAQLMTDTMATVLLMAGAEVLIMAGTPALKMADSAGLCSYYLCWLFVVNINLY